MSILKLHPGLGVLTLSLLMRDTSPSILSPLGRLDQRVLVPNAVDPAPPVELPFGPLRPPPEVDWAALPALLGEQIHTLGPMEVIIERQAFETIVANVPTLVSSSAPIPVQEGNRVVGVRLLGVRPDTLLGMLNVENGDVLERAGPYDIADPDQALAAYAHFRHARDFSLQFLRGAKRVSVHYAIR